MVRAPVYYVEIGNTTLDDMGLTHLVSSITCDSSVDKMDIAEISFAYGHQLDEAYGLLTHGQSIQIYLGYASESIYPVFFGFISGVAIDASARTVTLKLASYFKLMDKEEKKRSFEGMTVAAVISAIVADYPNIEVGTIDNGDYVLTDSMTQDSTDLDALVNLATTTGMHLVLEPSPVTGSTMLRLSLYTLGRETKPVEFDEIVYNPNALQQNQLYNWHLKQFNPESSVLGTDIAVTVQSVNPRYNTSSSSVVVPNVSLSAGVMIPWLFDHPVSTPALEIPDTSPPSILDIPVPTPHTLNPFESMPADDLMVATPQPVLPSILPPAPIPSGQAGWYAVEGSVQLEGFTDTTTTSSYQGTDVVFTCFGVSSTVHFSDNVTSEDAQRRIAEAIQNDSGFSFVVAKGSELADGEASLKVGQRRNIILNDFPLFGKAFSGEYIITGVQHSLVRSGSGFTTTFSGAKNTLEIPPEVVPATGIGAGGSDCPQVWLPLTGVNTTGMNMFGQICPSGGPWSSLGTDYAVTGAGGLTGSNNSSLFSPAQLESLGEQAGLAGYDPNAPVAPMPWNGLPLINFSGTVREATPLEMADPYAHNNGTQDWDYMGDN